MRIIVVRHEKVDMTWDKKYAKIAGVGKSMSVDYPEHMKLPADYLMEQIL